VMFTYVNIGVVLRFFIGIDTFYLPTQLSDWLELSENRCARSSTHLAAAERIRDTKILVNSGALIFAANISPI
jgi:hypothetical protein